MRIVLLAGFVLWSLTSVSVCRSADVYAVRYDIDEYSAERFSKIFILGPIQVGDEETFRKLMIDLIRNDYWPYEISVFSNGGAVYPAMRIGEQINMLMIPTDAPLRPVNEPGAQICLVDTPNGSRVEWKYSYRSESGDSRCRCDSACFLIWAGGGTRQGEGVYIHRPYFNQSDYAGKTFEQAQSSYKQMQEDVSTYLSSLEVPKTIIERMFSVNSQKISNLTESELHSMWTPAFAEELIIAKCGRSSVTDSRALFKWAWKNESRNRKAARIMKEVREHNVCVRKMWRSVFNERKSEYLLKYDH